MAFSLQTLTLDFLTLSTTAFCCVHAILHGLMSYRLDLSESFSGKTSLPQMCFLSSQNYVKTCVKLGSRLWLGETKTELK